MRGALRNHIIRKRQRLKQELEQEAIEKRLKRERELKRVQDAMTLDQIKEQLSSLEKKLEVLRDEKRHLFVQLKQLLSEDNSRRKQLEDPQTSSSTTTTTAPTTSQIEPGNNIQHKLASNNPKQEHLSPNLRHPLVAPMGESTVNMANQRPRLPPNSLMCANDASTVLRQQQRAINHITSQHHQVFPQQMVRQPPLSEHQARTSTYHFVPSSIPNSVPSPLTISTSYPDLPSYLRAQQGSQVGQNPLSANLGHFPSLASHRPPAPPFMPSNQLEFALQHPLLAAHAHRPISQIDVPISLTTSHPSSPFDANQIMSGKRSFSDANLNGDTFDSRGMGRKKPPLSSFPYPPTSRFQLDSLSPGLAQLGLLNHMTPTSGMTSIRAPPPAFSDHQPLTMSTAQSSIMNVPGPLNAPSLGLNYDLSTLSQADTPRPGLMLPGLNPYHISVPPPPLPHQHQQHQHQQHLLPSSPQLSHSLYNANIDLKNYSFHGLAPHIAARFGLPPLHEQNTRYLPSPNLANHHKKLHKNPPK